MLIGGDEMADKKGVAEDRLTDIDIEDYMVYVDDGNPIDLAEEPSRLQRNKENKDKGRVKDFAKIMVASLIILAVGAIFVRMLIGSNPNREEVTRGGTVEDAISEVYDGAWVKDGVTEESLREISKKIEAMPLGTDKTHYKGLIKKIHTQLKDREKLEEIMSKIYTEGELNYDVSKRIFEEGLPTNIREDLLEKEQERYNLAQEEMMSVYRTEEEILGYYMGKTQTDVNTIYELRREVSAWGESNRREKVKGYLDKVEQRLNGTIQTPEPIIEQPSNVQEQGNNGQEDLGINNDGLSAEEVLRGNQFNPNIDGNVEQTEEIIEQRYDNMVESIKEDIKKQVEEEMDYNFE